MVGRSAFEAATALSTSQLSDGNYITYHVVASQNGDIEARHFSVNTIDGLRQLEHDDLCKYGFIVNWQTMRWGQELKRFDPSSRVWAEKLGERLDPPDKDAPFGEERNGHFESAYREIFKMEMAYWDVEAETWACGIWLGSSLTALRCLNMLGKLMGPVIDARLPYVPQVVMASMANGRKRQIKNENGDKEIVDMSFPLFKILNWVEWPDVEDIEMEEGWEDEGEEVPAEPTRPAVHAAKRPELDALTEAVAAEVATSPPPTEKTVSDLPNTVAKLKERYRDQSAPQAVHLGANGRRRVQSTNPNSNMNA